jgi:3',5'-cyclic-AMP phosphodiesterase
MDSTGMTRIVHLSDAHVLDPRPSRTRSGWRVRFLSFGRPLDAVGRQRKLRRALRTAKQVGAHHVVVSGDLTEIGAPGEFEALAETLLDSRISPDRITLVPGNHDL